MAIFVLALTESNFMYSGFLRCLRIFSRRIAFSLGSILYTCLHSRHHPPEFWNSLAANSSGGLDILQRLHIFMGIF